MFDSIPLRLDELREQLAKARECERAAAMDVGDRAQDVREHKERLAKAEQRHEAAKAESDRIRKRIDFVIDAEAESDLDEPPAYKPTVCDNIGQFVHYGILEGPLE